MRLGKVFGMPVRPTVMRSHLNGPNGVLDVA